MFIAKIIFFSMSKRNSLSLLIHVASHCATCAGENSRKTMRGTSKTKMEIGRRKTTSTCKVDDKTRAVVRSQLYRILRKTALQTSARKTITRAKRLEESMFCSHKFDPEGYVSLFKIIAKKHQDVEQAKELEGLKPEVLPLVCSVRCESESSSLREAEPVEKTLAQKIEGIVDWRGGLKEAKECSDYCYKCCAKTRYRRKRLGLAEDGSDDPEKKPYGDVTYFMAQTHAADEAGTTYYHCKICGNRWTK